MQSLVPMKEGQLREVKYRNYRPIKEDTEELEDE